MEGRLILLVLFSLTSVFSQCSTTYISDTRLFAGTLRDIWPCKNQASCGTDLLPGQPVPICVSNPEAWQCAEDFERYIGDDLGVVQPFLDTVKRIPIFSGGNHPSVLNATQFPLWYQNDPTFNIAFSVNMTASNAATCNSLVYQYNNPQFFPINGQGFGNFYYQNGIGYNFGFTFDLHLIFTYQGNEVFSFIGDDDVWVFVNNQLAMDMGGVHSPESASIDLSWPPAGCASYTIPNPPPPCASPGTTNPIPCACLLGLQGPGNPYHFDLFYNERHTVLSDLKFTTSLFLQCPFTDWCGVCQGDGQSCCKCPSQGPCFSSLCDRSTGACIYTPKLCPAPPDACSQSVCNNTLGTCDLVPIICNSGSNCTIDSCDVNVGCVFLQKNCDDGNPCTVDSCDSENGCTHITIQNCNGCTDVNCTQVSDACTNWQCDPNSVTTPKSCKPVYTVCNDNNLCTNDSCDPRRGCQFQSISCDDLDPCTIDSCNSTGGCFHVPMICNDNNNCTSDACVLGNCTYTPIPIPASTRCHGVYCDPIKGIVHLDTVCPSACSVCDDALGGCQNCPSGFTTVYQVATGIGAGIIAVIVIAGVIFAILAAIGGKKGYDYYMSRRENVTTATTNPFYEPPSSNMDNPLHEG